MLCVCVCVCFYVVYVCMDVYVWMYGCMYVCMYVCMSVCLYVCMYVCMYVCIMYVVMDVDDNPRSSTSSPFCWTATVKREGERGLCKLDSSGRRRGEREIDEREKRREEKREREQKQQRQWKGSTLSSAQVGAQVCGKTHTGVVRATSSRCSGRVRRSARMLAPHCAHTSCDFALNFHPQS